jgi:hypothetical protein
MTGPETSTPDSREREMREKMLFKSREWKYQGYDTTALEEIIEREPDLRKVKSALIVFKEKIKALKEIGLELSILDARGFEARAEEIQDKLHDINALEQTKQTFAGLKAALELRQRVNPVAKGPERDQMLLKVKEWSEKGYDVLRIETFVKGEKDLEKVQQTIAGLEKKINILDKVRLALSQMDTSGFEAEVRHIERMVRQMDQTDIIWKEVYSLREKFKERRKEVVQAEATTRPVKIKVKKKIVVKPSAEGEAEAPEGKETTEVVQFRRIDLYIQLVQEILLANKRLLTLDTLRLAQRALKNDYTKILFFIIQKDFKIKSMMPDHPDSYRALEAFLNKLYATLSGLLTEEEAKDRLRAPAKAFITAHIQEILASGLDDYFPMFLIIDETEMTQGNVDIEIGDIDEWGEIVGKVKAWLDDGYKIDRLVKAIDGNRELALALFRKTEEEIFWLKELERDVHELEKKMGPRKELEEIRKKLLYPERISEIEDDILSLQMMVDLGDDSSEDADLI